MWYAYHDVNNTYALGVAYLYSSIFVFIALKASGYSGDLSICPWYNCCLHNKTAFGMFLDFWQTFRLLILFIGHENIICTHAQIN